MYPAIRLAKEFWRHRNAPTLQIGEAHVTHLICWPGDIDLFMEMNNGRTLTLYDLGRIVMFKRMGVMDDMKRLEWAGTVAGVSVRYRSRVRMFQKVEVRSTFIGWDDRFNYALQSMWRGKTCTSQVLLRMAITDRNGLVPSETVVKGFGIDSQSPAMPDWVHAWIAAENSRPWPPEK